MDVDARLHASSQDLFWLPPDVQVVDRPDVCYLACPRDVSYLNMVLRVGAEEGSLDDLIEEVQRAHQGRFSTWLLAHHSRRPGLAERLARRGYTPTEHHAWVISVPDFQPRPHLGITARPVERAADLLACMAVTMAAFGGTFQGPPPDFAEQLAACTGPNARVRRFVAWDDATGEPLAAGGLNLFPKLQLGFFWGGGTIPAGRRRGAYAALVAARVAEARARGFDQVGVYARDDTSAPLLAKQGFVRSGPVTLWGMAIPKVISQT